MDIILKYLSQHVVAGVLALLQAVFPFFFPVPAVLPTGGGAGSTQPVYQMVKGEDGVTRAEFAVLTYNVKHCQGGTKIAEVAAEIAATGAQVVFLQEIDCGTNRSGGRDEARLLAAELGFSYAFFPAMAYNGGFYGTAILSAFPLSGAKVTPLTTVPKIEPRALGQADIVVEGLPVRLFVTHMSYESGLARVVQFAKIRAAMRAAPGGSFLLGGDFNVRFYAEYGQLPAQAAHDARTEVDGLSRIDNLFCDREKDLRNVRSVPTGYSDHDLLLAEVRCG